MAWGGEARKQQASFLREAAYFTPEARVPHDDLSHRNPYLLPLGREMENLYPGIRDVASGFFSQRGIKWWKSSSSGDNTDVEGPTRNLASSQVACVNFLLPLSAHPHALKAILASLDDDIYDVLPVCYTARATKSACDALVEFEWVGLHDTLEGSSYSRGANATSADALLLAQTAEGLSLIHI